MKQIFILGMVLMLSSCATSYHRKSFTGGYSEIQLDNNIFRVSFKGNSRTSMERAVDFALLRSAELTLRNDYNYFTIIKGNHYVKEYYHVHPDLFMPYAHIVIKPRVLFKIKSYKTKPEKHSYNALLIAKSIRNKYRLK